MRLWAARSYDFLERLLCRSRVYGRRRDFDRWSSAWRLSYGWMARQMVARGICRVVRPPFWAWHSCGGWRCPPDDETWRQLLAFDQDGRPYCWCVIEFEAPDELVLLSVYGPWNDMMGEPIILEAKPPSRGIPPAIDLPEWQRVFDLSQVPRGRWEAYHFDVQAALPCFDRAWIRSVSVWPKLRKGQRYWTPRTKRKPV